MLKKWFLRYSKALPSLLDSRYILGFSARHWRDGLNAVVPLGLFQRPINGRFRKNKILMRGGEQMFLKVSEKMFYVMLLIILPGCVNGPIRYKTIGFREYYTNHYIKQSSCYSYPIVVPAGVMLDSSIAIADGVATPGSAVAAMFIYTFQVNSGFELFAKIITFPIYFVAVSIGVTTGLQFCPESDYEYYFGEEGSWFYRSEQTGKKPKIQPEKEPNKKYKSGDSGALY